MATSQSKKNQLQMAGEYGVCAELCKRGYDVSLTLGNAKAVDVFVGMPNNTYRTIEVKTTRSTRFVTNFFQKYGDRSKPHPDYWVLVRIDANDIFHYYVLSHDEMGLIQMSRNNMTTWESVPKGVDNVLLSQVSQYEGQWSKIV